MNLTKFFPLVIAIVFMSQNFSCAFIVHYSEVRVEETNDRTEGQNIFRCECNGHTRSTTLSENGLDKMFQSIRNKEFCVLKKHKICKWLDECNSCRASKKNCTASPNSEKGYICTKKTFEMRDKYLINADMNTGLLGKRRKRRQANPSACTYPQGMKTSSLYILRYPSSVFINQKCIFGHTLEGGISKERRCAYAENEWKPTGFEECKPFIDCTLTLTSTGSMQCSTGTVKKAPYCNVTCERYEDKPPVPKTSHECQINGKWTPKLPFCAQAGSGIDLVPPPRIRVHPEEEDPMPKASKKHRKGPRKT